MVKVSVNTFIEKEDFNKLESRLAQTKQSIYSFVRQAIKEKMDREKI